MRAVLLSAIFFVSVSSMAWIQISLSSTSNDYEVSAVITPDAGSYFHGTVVAETQSNGQCNGHYTFHLFSNAIEIDLVNANEMGIGNCDSEDITIYIGDNSYSDLMSGKVLDVEFKSAMFNNETMKATIQMTDQGFSYDDFAIVE